MSFSESELPVFESHDVVRDKYKQRHGGDVSAGKASEIVAFFSQGRQYFEAASNSGPLVAPLLAYYGVNALTRGAILFLDRSTRQATLKPSHGLQISDWQATLAGGLSAISDLAVVINTTGTFSEFIKATGGRTIVPTHTDDYKQVTMEVIGTSEIDAATTVTFNQVLSRMPDVQQMYADVMGEAPNVFNVGIGQTAMRDRTDVIVFGTRTHSVDEEFLVSVVPQLAGAVVSPHRSLSDNRHALQFSFSHTPPGPPPGMLPPLKYDGPLTLLVVPFPGGLDLSVLSILYLFSYTVGMLARYFPQHWLGLLTGGRGDRLYPLLREGLRGLYRSFSLALSDQLLVP